MNTKKECRFLSQSSDLPMLNIVRLNKQDRDLSTFKERLPWQICISMEDDLCIIIPL